MNGKYTFPDMAKNPYGTGPAQPLNQFTVDHPGTLIATAGHLHPGGLYDDLDLIRPGVKPASVAIKGSAGPDSVRLFRSNARYFDKRGPISWDMAMTATKTDWRPQVKAGDVMRISSTYETKRASWYESMGIMVVWEAWNGQGGTDPFAHRLDEVGQVTHGHLAEDNNHGGAYTLNMSFKKFPDCKRSQVTISGFMFNPGDFTASGGNRCTPTIRQGQSLTFVNDDASSLQPGGSFDPSQAYMDSVFHSITACQSPCGLNTGISYPLANGPGGYDSGQLGLGVPGHRQDQLGNSQDARAGDLHVLLPDPPVHARRVPGHRLTSDPWVSTPGSLKCPPARGLSLSYGRLRPMTVLRHVQSGRVSKPRPQPEGTPRPAPRCECGVLGHGHRPGLLPRAAHPAPGRLGLDVHQRLGRRRVRAPGRVSLPARRTTASTGVRRPNRPRAGGDQLGNR